MPGHEVCVQGLRIGDLSASQDWSFTIEYARDATSRDHSPVQTIDEGAHGKKGVNHDRAERAALGLRAVDVYVVVDFGM